LTEGLRQKVQAYGIEMVAVLPSAFATGIGDSAARFGPDRPAVTTAYGPAPEQAVAQVGVTLYGKVAAYGMDPQEVADAVSQLLALPAGTWPFHTSVNRITDNFGVGIHGHPAILPQRLDAAHGVGRVKDVWWRCINGSAIATQTLAQSARSRTRASIRIQTKNLAKPPATAKFTL
jgi:glycosyltransferase involved in cell wall biosynthesis